MFRPRYPRPVPGPMSDTEQITDEREGAAADAGVSPFAALGLAPELVSALTALGYEEPTPIQR